MTEGKTCFDIRRALRPNPGLPGDFLPGVVKTYEHLQFYNDPNVIELIKSAKLHAAAGNRGSRKLLRRSPRRVLDFRIRRLAKTSGLPAGHRIARAVSGLRGCERPVCRGMHTRSGREVWLCDINVNWIDWIDRFFNRPIHAFQNRIQPALPFEDRYFDLISAFSVFTHLDQDEMAWLLELRRILRPGGLRLYATVLDEIVWDRSKDPARDWLLKSIARGKNDDFSRRAMPAPARRAPRLGVFDGRGLQRQYFLPRKHLEKKWGALFNDIRFIDDHHNYQTVVVMTWP